MKANIATKGQNSFVTISGRLDASSVHDFDKTVAGLSEGKGPVIVDLSDLEFISSAGLRSILMLGKALKAANRPLAFCSLNHMVDEVFQISGFVTIFSIFSDRAAALASFAQMEADSELSRISQKLDSGPVNNGPEGDGH
ncbi:MAG: STAS domain-containing protein [Deltaproteobacteria bacterium]|jgi:anti-sigma B factor antagonist|nr:STAS domain-containing protein [Deltaproteobacteria bacterium]